MNRPVPTTARVAVGRPPDRRASAIVAALAVTQTVGYGTLYYAFAVFLTPLTTDLRASGTAVTGAFAASVLTAAALAVPVGRWLDRHGGRALMSLGSLAGAVLLVAWANVHTIGQLYVVHIGIGAAAAASLYEAAFAVVISWFTVQRRSAALLTLTVVAGFASSIFLPVTGLLVDRYGWRTALYLLAAAQAALTVPLHALVVRRAPHRDRCNADPPQPLGIRNPAPAGHTGAVRAALADRGFWLLAAGFTAHTAAISALTVHLVAALISWGHPATFAATVAGLLGALSVTGRLVTTGLHRRYRTTTVTAAVFGAQAIAAVLLPVVGHHTGGAIGTVVGIGLGFGVATIARPILLAERYDTNRYATLAGILAVPITLAKAAAPLAAAALHTATGTYTPVLLATAMCCATAAVATVLVDTAPVAGACGR